MSAKGHFIHLDNAHVFTTNTPHDVFPLFDAHHFSLARFHFITNDRVGGGPDEEVYVGLDARHPWQDRGNYRLRPAIIGDWHVPVLAPPHEGTVVTDWIELKSSTYMFWWIGPITPDSPYDAKFTIAVEYIA